MPRAKSLSFGQFWKYQGKVADNALRRWWDNSRSGWWVEASSALATGAVQFHLDHDPTWWQPVLALLTGGGIVTLLRFLVQIPISRALLDYDQVKWIKHTTGTMEDEQAKRRNANQILLYNLAESIIQDYQDLQFILDKNPTGNAPQAQVGRLSDAVDELDGQLRRVGGAFEDQYRPEFNIIRPTVRAELAPAKLVEELQHPIRQLSSTVKKQREQMEQQAHRRPRAKKWHERLA